MKAEGIPDKNFAANGFSLRVSIELRDVPVRLPTHTSLVLMIAMITHASVDHAFAPKIFDCTLGDLLGLYLPEMNQCAAELKKNH
jgi:hypothetical protein